VADHVGARGGPDDRLGAALRDLGRRIEYPAPTPLAAVVSRRLSAEAVARRETARPRPVARRVVLVLAVLGLLLAATAAVAGLIRVGGIELRFVESPAPATPRSLERLGLGASVTLLQAQLAADFQIRVPDAADLELPDYVLLDPMVPGGQVALVYLPGPGLPEIGDTGLGMVITQFGGRVDGVKELESGQLPEPVTFEGQFGYWIEGPHRFVVIDRDGQDHEVRAVLVGSTLLWTRDGVVYRIESALDREAALRVGAAVVD
jgi:hypothetical protein